jgi:hypothetical protein
LLHLRNADECRIIPDGVGLLEILKPVVHQFDSFQSFQDCFAYIVSADKEDRLGRFGTSNIRLHVSGK